MERWTQAVMTFSSASAMRASKVAVNFESRVAD
jgi:hypothetical protein